MCDWNAELHVQREDWADKILLELLAQDFTPVLSTEGWMMQPTSAMTAVPAQVHQAKWISLRFATTQRQKLSWIPGWNHGLPGHGLALCSKDVPIAIKMLEPYSGTNRGHRNPPHAALKSIRFPSSCLWV